MNILVEYCRKAIVVGTAIPLALFLIWDAVILGTLPGLAGDGTIIDPIEHLRSSNGTVGVSASSCSYNVPYFTKTEVNLKMSLILQPIVEAFSFLAIGTSYIGFVLGLSDFIADCKLSSSAQSNHIFQLIRGLKEKLSIS